MSLLTNIKAHFFRKRLEAERPRAGAATSAELPHPDSVKDITILFLADSAEDRKVVDKWRDANKQKGRKIKVLGYFEQEVGAASFDFSTVTVKDLNWYGAPQGEAVRLFKTEPTGLLLRLGPPVHPVLDFLADIKSAQLKVGPFSEDSTNPYQLQYDGKRAEKIKDQFAAIAQIFSFTNATASTTI